MNTSSHAIPGQSNYPLPTSQLEAIILAGGLGTRLRDAVPNLPKCMAPVAGRPFLYHVINQLRNQGVERFIFSLGYKHEVIEAYLAEQFPTMKYKTVIESEPLGTGGAIRLACQSASSRTVIIANGDTLFSINLPSLLQFHQQRDADCTLALKPMKDFDRYGVVETNSAGFVNKFQEKKFYTEGLINGGLYLLNKDRFLAQPLPEKFSFEKDFLEVAFQKGGIAAQSQDSYFIDIGIPEDFNRAQEELQRPPLQLGDITDSWTLFLDRDGVINEDKPGSYIFNPDEFVFMHGAPEIFKKLTSRFGKIIIATNQRGVGRGLMTEEMLGIIHAKMRSAIEGVGGKLDAILYATGLYNDDPYRKPNPGMAVHARTLFPDIDPRKSIMIGNNLSDMEFGRNAGMYTVFLTTTNKEVQLPHPDIDLIFERLEGFVKGL